MHPYRGASMVFSTKHGKEAVVTALFRDRVGARVVLPTQVDTDTLGTFTGERPRLGSVRDVLREKARMGMRETGIPLGLASEGSFGPHPAIPFVPCDHEAMVLLDDRSGIEIHAEAVSTETNFAQAEIRSWSDLKSFQARAGKGHAVILRPLRWDRRDPSALVKGLLDEGQLREAFDRLRSQDPVEPLWAETDMRAHLNPTRMRVIRQAAERLVERVLSLCPECGAPGFGLERTERGLVCGDCGEPTDRVRNEVWRCVGCGNEEFRPRADGVQVADPASCHFCNP